MAPCSNWGISICLFLFFFIVAYKQLEYPRKHGLSDGLSTFAINPARLQSLLSNRAYCMPITAHWALCFQHLASHNLGPGRINFFINSYAYVSYFLLSVAPDLSNYAHKQVRQTFDQIVRELLVKTQL